MDIVKGDLKFKEDGKKKVLYPTTSADQVQGLVKTIEGTMKPIVDKKAKLEASTQVVPAGHLFIESDKGGWKLADGAHLYRDLEYLPVSSEGIVNYTKSVLDTIAPVYKSAEEFASENLVYANGKLLVDEYGTLKIGTGTTNYNDLPIIGGVGGRYSKTITYDVRRDDGSYARGDGVISQDISFVIVT